jgi:hypothetical protein
MNFDPDERIEKRRNHENIGITRDTVTGEPVARPKLPTTDDGSGEDEDSEAEAER